MRLFRHKRAEFGRSKSFIFRILRRFSPCNAKVHTAKKQIHQVRSGFLREKFCRKKDLLLQVLFNGTRLSANVERQILQVIFASFFILFKCGAFVSDIPIVTATAAERFGLRANEPRGILLRLYRFRNSRIVRI